MSVRQALALSQIRSQHQGAGPAVAAMIGNERYRALLYSAIFLSGREQAPILANQPGLTRARGLMQFLRLTLAHTTGAIEKGAFVDELNQRLFNGWAVLISRNYEQSKEKRQAEIADLGEIFGGLKRQLRQSSIMPGSLSEFWQAMTEPRS